MRISDWSSDVCSSDLVLRGPTATILRMEGLAQASPNGSRSGGEAQEANRLRRGQDARPTVLRLEDFTVEDDVRPIALDQDLVALLQMHACEMLLPQFPAHILAQSPATSADVAVGRAQLHIPVHSLDLAGATA